MMLETSLLRFEPSDDRSRAAITVNAGERSAPPVSNYLTGKFCEHLLNNICQGMEAQVLRNPTFAAFPFKSGHNHPDGGIKLECSEERIAEQILGRAKWLSFPEPELLVESRRESLAHWWIREGRSGAIVTSPDVAIHGDRAQRVEVRSAGAGIAQWTFLPLHRTREYQWRIAVRSPDLESLSIRVYAEGQDAPCAEAEVQGLSRKWATLSGVLQVDPATSADAVFRFAITSQKPGQLVIARAVLYPADHVNGADPDVIRLLKESRLPLLRWPGGNFVSGYHWEDGVGPIDQRPTRPNMAWGHPEPNLFGTDEFLAFCREVGCEPLICVNAGSGTPEEAARWLEYCNGSADTPEGARRAANGHPDPYGVRLWEVGNETYGRWQEGWTKPAGHVDRFTEFAEALRERAPDIEILACGAHLSSEAPDPEWNEMLLKTCASEFRTLTHHLLVGGQVSAGTDPPDVFGDFMAVPVVFDSLYRSLQARMLEAGIEDPRLAVTELQLFAHLAPSTGNEARLTHDNLVRPDTLAEALYDTLLYHVAARMAPFIEIITHSATVNHGGGLRKQRERVYANPCHYAQALFSRFAGAVPVPVDVQCAEERAPGVLSCTPADTRSPMIDCLAAVDEEGHLFLSLVNRGTQAVDDVRISIDGIQCSGAADYTLLSAEAPWTANSLECPERVAPQTGKLACEGNSITASMPPHSLLHLTVPV